jgi:phage terminase Nu1 subunit (DNA packaging protein)
METTINYVNIQDIATAYLVTTKTVRNWVKKGLPCLKIGNVLRFNPTEVNQWLRNNK